MVEKEEESKRRKSCVVWIAGRVAGRHITCYLGYSGISRERATWSLLVTCKGSSGWDLLGQLCLRRPFPPQAVSGYRRKEEVEAFLWPQALLRPSCSFYAKGLSCLGGPLGVWGERLTQGYARWLSNSGWRSRHFGLAGIERRPENGELFCQKGWAQSGFSLLEPIPAALGMCDW